MEKKSIQSLGGKARAEALPRSERTQIAKAAAEARWSNAGSLLPKETHVGTIVIAGREIPCSVLEGGVRVFSSRGVTRAMGGKQTGARKSDGERQLPSFLASDAIKPFISSELMVRLISPIQYKPKHGGRSAFGYEAALLPQICEAVLDAEKGGSLKATRHKNLIDTAEVLLRGFARVGIIALVDEATGYQEERAKFELAKILEAYISQELMPWTKMFPDEFFKQIYRLQAWEYKPGSAKRTPYVGHLINKYIYEQLPPGVLEDLQRKNPVMEGGYRKHKHFQLLTADTGNPHLDKQITTVTTLMRISDDKAEFERNFGKAFGKPYQERLPLVIDVR